MLLLTLIIRERNIQNSFEVTPKPCVTSKIKILETDVANDGNQKEATK